MHKGLKAVSITLNTILIVIAILLLSLSGYILIERYAYDNYMPRVFGYSAAEVVTDSMSPTISSGDLIITKKDSSYEVGDIITFYEESSDSYITHRIIEIREDGSYVTQGDREGQAIDTYYTTIDDVVGKVTRIIEGGGATIDFLTSPVGIVVVIGSLVLIWLIVDISLSLYKNHKEEKLEALTNEKEGDNSPPNDTNPPSIDE